MSESTETTPEEISTVPVLFKKSSRKNLRKRQDDNEDTEEQKDSNNDLNSKLEEAKERQKLRSRPNGVNIIGLALGKKFTTEDELSSRDPFNTKSGGMVNMQALKSGKMKQVQVEDAYDVGIGTQFSAETNKRDEDEEMMKYIEEQLRQRKGLKVTDDNAEEILENTKKYLTPEEAALLALPDHLRQGSSQRSEEMLSNQMLNGIPEIDLGIDAKIKNIEATEDAKRKLLQDQKNKKDGPSQFVPTNMAVNFVQHNRFSVNVDDSEAKKRKFPERAEQTVTQPGKEKNAKKATDDYHYDKFKKQFRRY